MIDLLYKIAVWDINRMRRERDYADFIPKTNARIQRRIEECWRRGGLRGP